MKTYVRAVVRDRRGRVIKDTGYKRVNTLTKNFYAHLMAAGSSSDQDATRTDGSTGKIANPKTGAYAFLELTGGLGADGRSLVVGTGTAEPTRDDYNLASKIAHGDGAGQLLYDEATMVYGADYFEVRRTFTNQSGADITINEVGLIATTRDSAANAGRQFLIARALFTITIPNGGSATIYYRISG